MRPSCGAAVVALALWLDGAALALSEQGDGFWIGCSYGAISLPIEATDADDALRIADQRMYTQKNAGRASASRQVKEALLGVLAARGHATAEERMALPEVVADVETRHSAGDDQPRLGHADKLADDGAHLPAHRP